MDDIDTVDRINSKQFWEYELREIKEDPHTPEIIDTFSVNVVTINTEVLHKLFEFNTDSATLYTFYVLLGKLKKYINIDLDLYCIKYLDWNKKRYFNAKKVLLKQKLISDGKKGITYLTGELE
jgi:hypothetical protein